MPRDVTLDARDRNTELMVIHGGKEAWHEDGAM